MNPLLALVSFLLTPFFWFSGCHKDHDDDPPVPVIQTSFYVATNGSDANSGTSSMPLATLQKAVELVQAGDTILVRAGTYHPTASLIIEKSGTEAKPIHLRAETSDSPVFDCSDVVIDYAGVIDLKDASWWHLKGLIITKSPSKGIYIYGEAAANNILEQVVTRQNGQVGITISQGASNSLILNCDSYENFDLPKHGQNADGFNANFGVGPNNRFVGCRSWNNSDDGFDCWQAGSGVRFERCYTWANGLNLWSDPLFEGNGNGFKLGEGEGQHELVNCMAWDMPKSGFDLNGNTTGVRIDNCTAINCEKKTFYIWHGLEGGGPGTFVNNILRNNLAAGGGGVQNRPGVIEQTNSWNITGVDITESDFESLDATAIKGPRQSDGSVVLGSFLRLASGSEAVDAGTDIGIPFTGSAPDLGAIER